MTQTLPEPVRVRLFLAPSPKSDLFKEFRRMIRETVREEMHRKSFAAESLWLTQTEAQEYLKMSRTALYARRIERKMAKTAAAKAQAFAPEYGAGAALRFRRDELDAWMASQRA